LNLPNAETSVVIGNVEAVRETSEGDIVLGGRNVDGRNNMVSKTTMFIKVKDDETARQFKSAIDEVFFLVFREYRR
jgi:hypothetical protein